MNTAILYRTTNLLNDKEYIGVHSQSEPFTFDGYLGSGNLIKLALKKYGKENFKRETIFFGETDCMYELEEVYLRDIWKDLDNYNYGPGGKGGGHTGHLHSEESKLKMSVQHKGNKHRLGKTHSEESKLKMSKAHKGKRPWLGKTHSQATKDKLSQIKKGGTHTQESKIKMREAKLGDKNWIAKVSRSPQTKLTANIKMLATKAINRLKRLNKVQEI